VGITETEELGKEEEDSVGKEEEVWEEEEEKDGIDRKLIEDELDIEVREGDRDIL
jgi:hypothetical protein